MKKLLVLSCSMLLLFGVAWPAGALLFDRGGGLIYDSDQNITWLQDTNYAATSGYKTGDGEMNWHAAMGWADQLVYQGYDDWRLPATVDGQEGSGPYGYDGTTYDGYNITTSELGYMYYVNLGNVGSKDTQGTTIPYSQRNYSFMSGGPGGPVVPFLNPQVPSYPGDFGYEQGYWSGTDYTYVTHPPGADEAWAFFFPTGLQFTEEKFYDFSAWAVRDGDSNPVPEPATMLLFGAGLIGLAGMRKKFKK